MTRKTKNVTEADRALFEERMGRIMKELGVRTQVQLAEKIGVRQSSISDAKRRGSIPSDWLLRIWNETGVSPAWILDGDGCGHKFAVASDKAGELVNAAEIRAGIEAQVRAEVDNLDAGELIRRLRGKLPDVVITIGGQPEFEPMGDSVFSSSGQ
ncbi:helix-turn-helix domain-containing protein [Pseudodesulfovibrio karagichevae]|uniref:Helix-turn-helix domain-containing protein n=1 Tax=Pseudodesulfovibrio karagichevae TaxID=3239305 RepID=A0ABV4K4V7_9BACT